MNELQFNGQTATVVQKVIIRFVDATGRSLPFRSEYGKTVAVIQQLEQREVLIVHPWHIPIHGLERNFMASSGTSWN